MAGVPSLQAFVDESLNKAVLVVAAAEEHLHLADVPKVKKARASKTGKERPGRASNTANNARESEAQLRARDEVEALLAPKPAPGGERKRRAGAGRRGRNEGTGGRGRSRGRVDAPVLIPATDAAPAPIPAAGSGENVEEDSDDGEESDGHEGGESDESEGEGV